jgi:hypothetical protein
MDTAPSNPILVTGSHRSGSTWVGRMLALDPSVGFIMEPFNLNHRPGICRARFDYWFQYLSVVDGESYAKDIEDCLNFRYSLAAEVRAIRAPKDLGRMARDLWKFANNRLHGRRALIKDPIALFSAGWLAERFDMDVVVLIRHPAAFAGSLKAANWPHPFRHLLEQERLLERYLSGFRDEIERQVRNPGDIVDQAILLWNLVHHTILLYQQEHSEWHYLRHEDISLNPVGEFRKLFGKLGLVYSDTVQKEVIAHTSSEMPDTFKRDSRANISTWRQRLTDTEIRRVKEKTHRLSKEFYSEESWN